MAVRQYIGARYVPKLDGEWSSEKVYEPLTIVMYNNGSYTSKKNVSAGILPTNTEYWAFTGNYNAQVEAYRQEVNTYKDEVDACISEVGVINSKLAKYNFVNVVEIGCDNTGNTDISAIINNRGLTSGIVLYFPKGTYKCATPIYLPANCIVTGEKATIKGSFIATNGTGITINNLTFDTGGILLNKCSNCKITECNFVNCDCGINLQGCLCCFINDNNMGNVGVGVLVDGIEGGVSASNIITSNTFKKVTTYNGVLCRTSYYDIVSDNYVEDAKAFSISMKECYNGRISNNVSINSIKEAYNLQDCIACVIDGNTARWTANISTDFGISCWGTTLPESTTGGSSKENMVSNNIVQGSFKSGIALADRCFGDVVADNFMDGCSTNNTEMGSGSGIILGAFGGTNAPYACVVKGNIIVGNGVTNNGIKETTEGNIKPSTCVYNFNTGSGLVSTMLALSDGSPITNYNVPV